MAGQSNSSYYLEKVELDDSGSDEEFAYHEVQLDLPDSDDDEDFAGELTKFITPPKNEVAQLKQTENVQPSSGDGERTAGAVTRRPEVVDDFIRNVLHRAGMTRTLEVFQTEWYEHKQRGQLSEELSRSVPDVYATNYELEGIAAALRREAERWRETARQLQTANEQLQKQRDFHKMHHKRVAQEKKKLEVDIRRLKQRAERYEPEIEVLKHKWESATKEKMLARLERDRLAKRIADLEALVASKGALPAATGTATPPPAASLPATATSPAATSKPAKSPSPPNTAATNGVAAGREVPAGVRPNPYADGHVELATAAVRRLSGGGGKAIRAHTMPIPSMAMHPTKAIVATVSDDTTWKMWALPNGELIMSGDGHKDWLSDCDFHPAGGHLVTSSGDRTLKLWDFRNSVCSATFTEHTQAVWSCAFHDTGDWLVSCSADQTAKLWDIATKKCRQSLRGHVGSVNTIAFWPFTNVVATGAADKTVSLWDVRSGLCRQTFLGHSNSVNHVCFTLRADSLASTDADGVVKLWDLRMATERLHINAGPLPANKACFDPIGRHLVVPSDDGTIKIYDLEENTKVTELKTDDAVQCVLFDPSAKYLISSGSDATFRVWLCG